jgi:hypothetical protein
MTLTRKQTLWLKTRGGRDEDDIVYIDDLPHVMMWSSEYRDYMPIKIPKDKDIVAFVEIRKHSEGRAFFKTRNDVRSCKTKILA